MVGIFISVGSNVDAVKHIQSGILALHRQWGVLRISRVYESEAVGFDGDNFLNLVVAANVDEPVESVVSVLRSIEDEHRRDRNMPRFSPRTLDLDLLLYGDAVFADKGLNIPRDEITKNAFVLAPLAELAPDLLHPVAGTDYQTLWAQYDKSSQKLWPVEFEWPPAVKSP